MQPQSLRNKRLARATICPSTILYVAFLGGGKCRRKNLKKGKESERSAQRPIGAAKNGVAAEKISTESKVRVIVYCGLILAPR